MGMKMCGSRGWLSCSLSLPSIRPPFLGMKCVVWVWTWEGGFIQPREQPWLSRKTSSLKKKKKVSGEPGKRTALGNSGLSRTGLSTGSQWNKIPVKRLKMDEIWKNALAAGLYTVHWITWLSRKTFSLKKKCEILWVMQRKLRLCEQC